MMSKPLQIVAGFAAALALFLAGRLTGTALSPKGSKAELGASDADRVPVSVIAPKPTSAGVGAGVSDFVAERDGFSATARRLLALFDGADFTAELVALSPAKLDLLVKELAGKNLPHKFRQMAEALFRRWVEIDPLRKVERTLSAESGPLAEYSLRLLALQALAQTDPESALLLALDIGDERMSSHFAGEVLEKFAMSDPAGAAQFLLERDLFSQADYADAHLAALLVSAWAKTDLAAAADFINRLPEAKRATAIATLARIWPKTDAPAAYRWLAGRTSIDDRQMKRMLEDFVATASTSDPDFVIELINSEEGDPVREHALEKLAAHYTRTDTEAALEWIGTLEDFDDALNAGLGVIGALPAGDTQSFSKVISSLPAGAKHWVFDNFVARWAQHTPDEAIEWAARETDPRTKLAAVEGLVTALTSSDEGGTHHAEIAALVDEDRNLQRIWADYLAGSWAQVDAPAAFGWARAVASPTEREKALRDVLHTWARRDPAAARSALGTLEGLPEETRARLLKELPAG